MEIVRGTAAFPGIAIGEARYYYQAENSEEKNLDASAQLALLSRARDRLEKELLETKTEENQERLWEEQEILHSPAFFKALEDMICSEKVHATYALAVTEREMEEAFGGLETPFIKKRLQAMNRVSERLLFILEELTRKTSFLVRPGIVVAEALTPAQMISLEKENLLALVTRVGSEVAHSSIMAKSLNVPVLADVDVKSEWNGKLVIVDGYTGNVYIDPDAETWKEYEIRRKCEFLEKEALLCLKDEEDVTLDGKQVGIYANIGSLDDLDSVKYYGAAGIGLIRSEFQYLGRENYPGEEELFEGYRNVAEAMEGKLAIIRTVDLGADKQSEYMKIPPEINPIMGNRGIRFCLDHREILKSQLSAIYRAGAYGRLAVMYPMITSLEEIDELRLLEEEVKAELRERKLSFCDDMETGIMIETPAAVMISRELAQRVDFLSLGTNDLTQYTLAMDRQNPNLKDKYLDHHPAILRMIELVILQGHKEGCKVMICGELASDITLTEKFLKMGIDALSVVPACILPVRKVLRSVKISERR